jgi:type I restriction enzyme R subunit
MHIPFPGKVQENDRVMMQIANIILEQAMLGDFPKAGDDAMLGSHEAHREQMSAVAFRPRSGSWLCKGGV